MKLINNSAAECKLPLLFLSGSLYKIVWNKIESQQNVAGRGGNILQTPVNCTKKQNRPNSTVNRILVSYSDSEEPTESKSGWSPPKPHHYFGYLFGFEAPNFRNKLAWTRYEFSFCQERLFMRCEIWWEARCWGDLVWTTFLTLQSDLLWCGLNSFGDIFKVYFYLFSCEISEVLRVLVIFLVLCLECYLSYHGVVFNLIIPVLQTTQLMNLLVGYIIV